MRGSCGETLQGGASKVLEESLRQHFESVALGPPGRRDIPPTIRGVPLPQDYIRFLADHDGGHLVKDRSALDLDEVHIELFPLGAIEDGSRYRDDFGGYLGSELSMRERFQNPGMGVRTTANDIPCDEAEKRYQQFYRDHLVIGFVWTQWEEPIRWIALLAVDRDGAFFLADDWDIEHGTRAAWRGKTLQALLEKAAEV